MKYYRRICLLHYHYFKDHQKIITKIMINLSKQKALDGELKAIQQNIFTRKMNANATIFFILEEIKSPFDINIK